MNRSRIDAPVEQLYDVYKRLVGHEGRRSRHDRLRNVGDIA
jgi:hypothetical protein